MLKPRDYDSIRVKELTDAIERVVRGTSPVDSLKSVLLVPDKFLKTHRLEFNGLQYVATGKVGNRIGDSMMCREFRNTDNGDSRVWLYRDGSIKSDD